MPMIRSTWITKQGAIQTVRLHTQLVPRSTDTGYVLLYSASNYIVLLNKQLVNLT